MKKYLLIILPLYLIVAVPALANQDNKGKNENRNEQVKNVHQDSKAEATAEPTKTCGPDEEWENHGQYVSCVAKQKLGGKETSTAAKSDIGKKEKGYKAGKGYNKYPSLTHGKGKSVPLTVEPTVSVSPTGTSESATLPKNQLKAIIDMLEKMIGFFKHLL